jgi:hypothetical protein
MWKLVSIGCFGAGESDYGGEVKVTKMVMLEWW